MPTIHHRLRCKMVGTLSLCPPYGGGVICDTRKGICVREPATHRPDGQISKNLSSPSRKNIPLNLSGKSAA